jgi:NTP pyrophosphatase (non-canonical NTP hydrolase)
MDLKEIIAFQKKFDEKHGWTWEGQSDKEVLERLKYVTIALSGEVGEFANVVKKALRKNFPEGSLPDEEKMEMLREELTDVFIYTILASRVLKVDLEEAYFKKVKELEVRFKDLERKGP